MFIQLVKVVMFAMHLWLPILGFFVNIILTALWAFSIYGQAGPDMSDAAHPSHVAWYISKSCSYAQPYGYEGYCLQAKGAFATTVIMMYAPTLSLFYLPLELTLQIGHYSLAMHS